MNDVTSLGGGRQGFCDESIQVLILKRVKIYKGC